MFLQINKLFFRLNCYKHIIFYGAGMYAKSVFSAMKLCGLDMKVTCFVVSDIQDKKIGVIDGIPIISFNQLSEIAENSIILIAVGRQYSCEIEGLLYERGYNKYLALVDFEQQTESLENWNIQRKFQELYEYIVQFCLSNQLGEPDNKIISSNGEITVAAKKSRNLQDRKQIIFIVGLINGRISRIAVALKKIGYRVRIFRLLSGSKAYIGEAELIQNHVEIIDCFTLEEIIFRSYRENPLVYCIDPPWENNSISRLLLVYKEYFGKIVLMPYDILNLSHFRSPKKHYELERYALENADGVVWRYFCKRELEKKLGWKYQGKSIDFLDCCAQYNLSPKKSDKEIVKMCCLPTHVKPFLEHIDLDSVYVRDATVWEILGKIGNRCDCEFHVYFWSADDEDLEKLNEIRRQYSNFYYYIHIEHDALISQMAQYDYGCYFFKRGEIPKYPDIIGVGLEYYLSEGTFLYSSLNKYYDFLSANLPIIASYPKKLCKLLSDYGVIVDMSLEELNIEFLKNNAEVFYARAKKAHNKLLIDSHISELVDFFENDLYEGQ